MLRINRIRIEIATEKGLCGFDTELNHGLNFFDKSGKYLWKKFHFGCDILLPWFRGEYLEVELRKYLLRCINRKLKLIICCFRC